MSSRDGLPVDPSGETVSTTFHATAVLADHSPDVILISSDGVQFYVHSSVLLAVSSNGFAGILLASTLVPVHVAEKAQTLNIVLRVAYDLDPTAYAPDKATLVRALDALIRYGLPWPDPVVNPLMFALLLRTCGAQEVFALAAERNLESLAVGASAHMLAFSLSSVTDEWAVRIGPVYLRRLLFLHLGRVDAFKRILTSQPLPQHAHTPGCGPTDKQANVVAPWNLAIAQLIADARPDLSSMAVESRLNPIAYRCACAQCAEMVTARVRSIITEWDAVKRTI